MMLGREREKALLYALEKAHRYTVSYGYSNRETAQDKYLSMALMQAGIKTKPSDKKGLEPEIIFALVYCLSMMDDDTYARLMARESVARDQLIDDFRKSLVTNPNITVKILHHCVYELTQFEIKRVAREHIKSAAIVDFGQHEAKNFRFVMELETLLSHAHFAKMFTEESTPANNLPRDEDSCSSLQERDDALREEIQAAYAQELEYRCVKNLADHWVRFQENLKKNTTLTPAALMTKTLLTFGNMELLKAWRAALENYCRDPYGFLPETYKERMRLQLRELESSCGESVKTASFSDLTGARINMFPRKESEENVEKSTATVSASAVSNNANG